MKADATDEAFGELAGQMPGTANFSDERFAKLINAQGIQRSLLAANDVAGTPTKRPRAEGGRGLATVREPRGRCIFQWSGSRCHSEALAM